jgi:hypothetical protein
MSGTETVEAPTLTGTEATTTADPSAAVTTTPADGQGDGAGTGQDQSKPATLLTGDEPAKVEPPVVPEAYSVTIPEKSPIGADVLAKVTELAKGLSVTDSAHVQAIVDLIHGEAVSVMTAQQDALKKGGPLWTEHVKRLEAEALADPEVGGTPERLSASLVKAKATLSEYADAEFAQFLEETGLGSDKRLLKLLVKVQDRQGEDRIVSGETPRPKPKSVAQTIYPNHPSKDG